MTATGGRTGWVEWNGNRAAHRGLGPRCAGRSWMRRAALALILVCCALALALPDPAPAITIGIADQRPLFFTNSSFQRTRIGRARILVGWDALEVDWQRAELDAWFGAARAAGVTPLVTFGRSRTRPDVLPTPDRYEGIVRAFRTRYPWVREFSTWNEANSCGERTCHRASLVAAWYRRLRIACPGCTLLAADLVDQPNLGDWASAFRRSATVQPTRWGLHNYLDANRHTTRFTRQMLAATRGRLWLTETGGLVARHNASTTVIPQGFTHAANATAYLFDTIRRVSGRIQRIYLYNWVAPTAPFTWDSAFVSSRLQERRSYGVLRDRLARLAHAGLLTGRLQ
ncbi:MAG TPA: hypothetical protein VII98_05790 [Solirubrobacteraceae bacterium]